MAVTLGFCSLFLALFLSFGNSHWTTALPEDIARSESADVPPTNNKWQSDTLQALLGGGGTSLGGSASKSRDMDAVREKVRNMDWSKFTPAPIEEPDCHVEIQVMQKVPGRCIGLGRNQVPACQTQNWVSFNSEECMKYM